MKVCVNCGRDLIDHNEDQILDCYFITKIKKKEML